MFYQKARYPTLNGVNDYVKQGDRHRLRFGLAGVRSFTFQGVMTVLVREVKR